MTYLLDTCVISEVAKREPNPAVVQWLESHDEKFLHLSVITIGEVQKGIAKLEDAVRRQRLGEWLEQLTERFGSRLLPIDAEVMRAWGTLVGSQQRDGMNLPTIDAMIAATASVHGLVVVSRNVQNFERCHMTVVNPWSS
jgi:hypothetical protein